jgi:hypothetical protein
MIYDFRFAIVIEYLIFLRESSCSPRERIPISQKNGEMGSQIACPLGGKNIISRGKFMVMAI